MAGILPLGILHALSGLSRLSELKNLGQGNHTYNLLKYDDVEGNIKRIGDKIIDKIQKDYINGNPEDTPEKIKAQIKLDALTIYYENSGERKVKKNIKEKVCQTWYGALRARNEKIMKDIVFLLNKQDVANPTITGGGLMSGGLLGKNQNYNNSDPLYSAANALTNGGSNGMMNPTQLSDADAEQPVLSEKETREKEETDRKNNMYLEKLIEYKSKLFEIENFEKRPLQRSATVSQVYELHESIISKILCNYAVINRNILVGELRKIILGTSAIKELEGTADEDYSNEKDSVYKSFIQKMQDLGNIEKYRDKSSQPTTRLPQVEEVPTEQQEQTGGKVSNKIPEYIPSTYIWENIKGYVEGRLQIRIQEKINLNSKTTESIKEGFQEVFLQANCDSLDLVSTKNEEMTEMLNQEYHRMLDYLCKNIPDKYAAPILQSYILRNFDEFTNYLATIFKEEVGVVESFFLGYKNVPSKMFDDKNVKPVYPEIKREDVPADADYDALDDCCNKRDGDKDLDATGVSGFIKTENIGKEPSIKDRFTPSILLPAFNVFKKEFTECSENTDFLAVLFNMYSGKSIKFMQQIQQQFTHDGVNDFIERYILTKHPYTTKIIAECIKHASDIKITLSKTAPKEVDENGKTIPVYNSDLFKLVSQYAAFLMHYGSDISLKIDTSVQNAHTNYVKTQIPIFSGLCKKYNKDLTLMDISGGIIAKLPPQEMDAYNKALRKVFNANKSTSNSVKRITKKVRVDLGAKKRYISSFFNKKPESKETTSETAEGVTSEKTPSVSETTEPH